MRTITLPYMAWETVKFAIGYYATADAAPDSPARRALAAIEPSLHTEMRDRTVIDVLTMASRDDLPWYAPDTEAESFPLDAIALKAADEAIQAALTDTWRMYSHWEPKRHLLLRAAIRSYLRAANSNQKETSP